MSSDADLVIDGLVLTLSKTMRQLQRIAELHQATSEMDMCCADCGSMCTRVECALCEQDWPCETNRIAMGEPQ